MDVTRSFVSIFMRVLGWDYVVPLVLVLGVGVGVVALNEMLKDQRLRHDGVVLEAVVTGKEKRSSTISFISSEATPFAITYSFAVPDGREFTGVTSVSEKRFDVLKVGSPVRVVYWRKDPNLNWLDGTPALGASEFGFLAVMALIMGTLTARRVVFTLRAIAARDFGEALVTRVARHHRRITDDNDQLTLNFASLFKRRDEWLDWTGPDGLRGSTLNLSLDELLDHPVGSDLTVYRHPKRSDFVISAAEVGLPTRRSCGATSDSEGTRQ